MVTNSAPSDYLREDSHMYRNCPIQRIPCSGKTEICHEPKDTPPSVILIGLNHTTASVELRECFAFSKQEIEEILALFQSEPLIREVLVISTCNRVEILAVTNYRDSALAYLKKAVSDWKQIDISRFDNALYVFEDAEAVRHLFRVAASLDSMIIGEPQILGQIKEAYALSASKNTSGVILNKLLHRTFFVAKRVRTETGIGDHAVSVSYAAIELGKKIFGSLEGKNVLLIGAGEMAELAVEHLIRNQAGSVYVVNRTFERGLELAQRFRGKAMRFEELPECLRIADIIISSTGSPHFVVSRDQVKSVMRSRKNRPLFFIDIAVPRDIDPEINKLPNSYVYDIDDLKGVIDDNIEDRRREAVKAERIIDEAVFRFFQWYDSLKVIPTIIALRNKMEIIAKAEIRKTLHSMPSISEKDQESLFRMTNAMINKILHDPTQFLKKNGCRDDDKSEILDITRKLFKLDESATAEQNLR